MTSSAQGQVVLESDVGEGFGAWSFGDDEALLATVTAANVACGFHGGDPAIMRATCREAVARGVALGAHVSYRDLHGFGRRRLDVPAAQLIDEILYQFGALQAIAAAAGGAIEYVKAHGALYNTAAVDTETATAIASAISLFDPSLPVLCQAGSVMQQIARQHGLRTLAEVFADRGYTAEGLLVARHSPGALITDPDTAAARVVDMVQHAAVTAVDGTRVEFGEPAAAICVHSDTPGAAVIAAAIRRALTDAGIQLGGIPRD